MVKGFRETLLLLAGAAISAAAGLWGSLPGMKPPVPMIVLFGLGFLLVIWAFQTELQQWLSRSYRKRYCRIGILNDKGWNSEFDKYSSWTDVPPCEWKSAIERIMPSHADGQWVDMISRDTLFDGYSAILNPYGGTYPESDLKTQITLHKIVEYVADGGVFVSIADIPGYYAYSFQLQRRVDMTPANWPIELAFQGKVLVFPFRGSARSSLTRYFARTPLMETLGLTVVGIQPPWSVEEGAVLSSPVQHVGEIVVDRVV